MNYVHNNKRNTKVSLALLLCTGLFVSFASPLVASAALLSRQLELGMEGSDVTLVQEFLALDSEIYPEGIITGYYGQLTQAAVSRFQTKHHLESVGRVGPLTLALLQEVMAGEGSDEGELSLMTETVRTTSNVATFTWYASEPAFAKVIYGSSWPFVPTDSTEVNATGGLSTYQTVTIADLAPNSTYYYVLHSTDLFGNSVQTIGKQFSTSDEFIE